MPEPKISTIVHKPTKLILGKQASYQLKPIITYSPEKIGDDPAEKFVLPANRTLQYTSSKDSIAEVTPAGKITTKAAGNCDITITAANGKKCTVPLVVANKDGQIKLPSKLAITCSDPSDKMYVSEELSFTAKGLDADGNEDAKLLQEVRWTVNSYSFEITEDGKLTCQNSRYVSSEEKITVTASSIADNSISATKEITMCKNIADIQAVKESIATKRQYCFFTLRDPYLGFNFY